MNYPLPQSLSLARPTSVRYGVLAWVCVLSMITYIDRVCMKQVRTDMQVDLGLTDTQFALAFAAFGLAYALFEVPSGWLGDRFGPRRVLTRIVLCWSVFTALTGCVWRFSLDSGYEFILPGGIYLPILFDSLALLVIIRFLFGAGEAGAYPNIARAMRNWFPYERRGMAQGLLWMSGRWGGALAPLLVGLFASGLGWRGPFWVFGLVGAVWVVSFAYWFRDTPAEHPSVNEAERALIQGNPVSPAHPTPAAVEPPPLSWKTMLKSRTLWCLCLMYFCSNAGWCFFITWDVKYYEKVLHLSGRDLEIASRAPLFFGGVACMLGGFLTDRLVRVLGRRWGRTLQGLVSYALGGVFFLLAVSTGNPWLAVTALCIASFLKDFAMAASWSTCIDIGHRYSGTVAGFMNMVGNMGTAVSPIVVPYLAGAESGNPERWDLALVYSACMFFSAAAAWAFINPKRVVVYTPEERRKLLEA
jgi:MFS family permease